jgi:Tol biopolymer transport system component
VIDETRIERALRQGPAFGTHFVPRQLSIDSQVSERPGATPTRRLLLVVAMTALLLVASVAALTVAGFFRPQPMPNGAGWVLEQSDVQLDALEITHLGLAPGTGQPVPVLSTLPANAVMLRWSPDGNRMTYFTLVPTGTRGGLDHHPVARLSGLYLANGDGSNPVEVAAPRSLNLYGGPGLGNGARWSPDGTLVAISWYGDLCGLPNCIPDSGTDVFDASGRLVVAVTIPNNDGQFNEGQFLEWSPDSQRIGWASGRCEGDDCFLDAFNHRSVRGSEAVTTVALPPWSGVIWSTTNRLLVVTWTQQYASVQRVYSMALDGSDEQEITWDDGVGEPLWSPDGRWIAASRPSDGRLTIRDVEAGDEVVVTVPTGLDLFRWSPTGEQLILSGGALNSSYALYVVNVDGTGFRSLGDAQDVTWRPAR